MCEIEKNIQIPERKFRRSKYPLGDLEVGDSIFIRVKSRRLLSGSISYNQKKYPGRKFVTRIIDDGIRVWRVK